jgi:hypothetical protein
VLLSVLIGLPGVVLAARASTSLSIINVQVSHDAFLAHSEPAIAENPRDRNDLIAGSKLFTDPQRYAFKIGTFYSLDGGRTWKDNGPLPGFEAYDTTSDISFAFSSSGVAYAAVLACSGECPQSGRPSGIFVSRSTDGGRTWSNPATVFVDSSGQTFSDKPWITVDRSKGPNAGTVYVGWNLDGDGFGDPDRGGDHGSADRPAARAHAAQEADGSPVGLVVASSSDGGLTFSAPVVVQPFTKTRFPLGAIPQVSPNGTLSVVYSSSDTNTGIADQLKIVQSTDAGRTFSTPRVIQRIQGLPNHLPNSTFRNFSLPSFAVSRKDGSMVTVWADERNGDADILATTSTDGGLTWTAPVRVNHDRLGNGKDQFEPEIAVAPNGTYTCSWFDRRKDRANTLIDVYIARSTDGGKTFGENVRVTNRSWNPGVDAPQPEGKPNNTFIGDYQALAVDDRTVHPLWNDTQDQRTQQIRTAVLSVRIFARR